MQVSRRKNFEDDAEDQVKEEEEKQLLEIEERERKEEELRAQKGDKRNSIKKDSSKLPGPKKTSSEFSVGVLCGVTDVRCLKFLRIITLAVFLISKSSLLDELYSVGI